MDDDALAGTRVLVIGGNRDAAESLRSQLTAAGSPSVDLVPSLELVAAQAAAAQPQVVLSLGDTDPAAVRARLDPLGLDSGPARGGALGPRAGRRAARPGGHGRLRMVLEHRAMRARLGELEAIVASQALSLFRDTEAIRVDTLERLAQAAEYRDDNSPEHMQRVAALAARMGRQMGQDDRMVWLIRQAAPLHDLGKIAIPDSILLKPGRLEPEEYEVVKTHAVLGARVLADSRLGGARRGRGDRALAPRALGRRRVPGRPRGGGDPARRAARRRSRTCSTCSSTSGRTRRPGRSRTRRSEIRSGSGTQFDPAVVAAFDALGAGSWTAGLESS